MIFGGEHNTRRIEKYDVLVELNLLHSFGHARSVARRCGPRSLQRVDETGLADIGETNNTNRNGLLILCIFDTGIVL